MKASDFREWIRKIPQLSRGQKEQTKHSLGGMAPRIEGVKWLIKVGQLAAMVEKYLSTKGYSAGNASRTTLSMAKARNAQARHRC